VEFAELEDEAICAYAASGEPMGKAGGYGIQVCLVFLHWRLS
jgi:predicted house-cleaning NTP pyrophosphatase (Maf/HAM1 superfamily)